MRAIKRMSTPQPLSEVLNAWQPRFNFDQYMIQKYQDLITVTSKIYSHR